MFDSNEELLQQISLGEDSAIAFKNIIFSDNKIIEPDINTIADEFASMANANSGVYIFGVDDKSKTITGIPKEKLDCVEQWLQGICIDFIEPQLFCRIRKIPLTIDSEIKCIIRVDIAKSLFVHQSPGGFYYRVGSSKRKMSTAFLARLFQQRSQARLIRFDAQAVSFAPSDCLEKKYWQKFKNTLVEMDDQEFLLKAKLLTKDEDGKICPTVAGILLASHEPQIFLRNAFIQAVCYRGIERNANDQIDAHDFTGPLDEQILDAYNFVNKNMRIYAKKDIGRQDFPQFSMQAVFEALVNAVVHRDYSIDTSKIRLHLFFDRLELFSPGAIPNTMTIDNLPHMQASRNELLTSLLARSPFPDTIQSDRKFFMDRRGEGVPIILNKSQEISGKMPEYRLIGDEELLLTIYAYNP